MSTAIVSFTTDAVVIIGFELGKKDDTFLANAFALDVPTRRL